MGRVDHQHVDAGLHQQVDPLLGAVAHAHCGAHAQLALRVARGVREVGLLGDVLDGHQATQFEGVVDHQHPLQLVLVHQRLALEDGGAFLDDDELVARRHDLAHRGVQAGFEAQIAAGDDAHHAAILDHREARDAVLTAQRDHVAHRHAGRHGDRVAQHARLIALDACHLGRLLLGREVLVHDADATLLRQGDGQARLGHGVHRGGHQGQVQADVARQLGRQRGVTGQHLGEGGHQQHIVEGERFA